MIEAGKRPLPAGLAALGHAGRSRSSLAGWAALLLPERHGLALLVVATGGFWLYEHRVAGPAFLPPGYLDLRRQLSLAVCALLTLGLLAVG